MKNEPSGAELILTLIAGLAVWKGVEIILWLIDHVRVYIK